MDKVINNCKITKSDAKVIKEYVYDASNPLYKKYGGYSSGIELSAYNIYSLYAGTVAYVGKFEKRYTVIIAYDKEHLVSYNLLTKVLCKPNEFVDIGTLIGYTNKSVRFEYLTLDKSRWPVRVLNDTYYKNDPTDVLLSGGASLYQYDKSVSLSLPDDKYIATQPFNFQDKQSLNLDF